MKQSTTISLLKLTTNPTGLTHLKTELYYNSGGMNFFHSKVERRGLYIICTPVEISKSASGYTSEMTGAFSGAKQLVKEMGRFSQKTFDSFDCNTCEAVKLLTDHVLAKHNLTIETPQTK